MYAELLQGLREDPREHLKVVFDEQHDEMVLVKDVPFSSMCEHHLLPFHGRVHAAYIPHGKVVGLSKIARVIGSLARRLQVQERMTSQIADLLMEELEGPGRWRGHRASHTCMTMRGIKSPAHSWSRRRCAGRLKKLSRRPAVSFCHWCCTTSRRPKRCQSRRARGWVVTLSVCVTCSSMGATA